MSEAAFNCREGVRSGSHNIPDGSREDFYFFTFHKIFGTQKEQLIMTEMI